MNRYEFYDIFPQIVATIAALGLCYFLIKRFLKNKIIFWSVICGWILFLVAIIGRVNPAEGSVISDYIREPLGGLLLIFLIATTVPAMIVAIILAFPCSALFAAFRINFDFAFGFFYIFFGLLSQAFIYTLIAKIVMRCAKYR